MRPMLNTFSCGTGTWGSVKTHRKGLISHLIQSQNQNPSIGPAPQPRLELKWWDTIPVVYAGSGSQLTSRVVGFNTGLTTTNFLKNTEMDLKAYLIHYPIQE